MLIDQNLGGEGGGGGGAGRQGDQNILSHFPYLSQVKSKALLNALGRSQLWQFGFMHYSMPECI